MEIDKSLVSGSMALSVFREDSISREVGVGGARIPISGYPFKTRKMYKTETMFWAFR